MPLSRRLTALSFSNPYQSATGFLNPANAFDGNTATYASNDTGPASPLADCDVGYYFNPGGTNPRDFVWAYVYVDYEIALISGTPTGVWSITIPFTGQTLATGSGPQARVTAHLLIRPYVDGLHVPIVRFHCPNQHTGFFPPTDFQFRIYEVSLVMKTAASPVRIDG